MIRITNIIFVCAFSFVNSQIDGRGLELPWYKGSIDLSDGTKLVGLVQNNEKLRLIRYRVNLVSEIQFIDRKDIHKMEYYDSLSVAHRRFALVNYRVHVSHKSFDDKMKYFNFNGEIIEDKDLFEVIIECNRFAVFAKVSSTDFTLRMNEKGYLNPTIGRVGNLSKVKKRGLDYFEEFYVFDDLGKLYPLVTLNYTELGLDKQPNKAVRRPPINRLLLKKYMGGYWEEVESYMEDEKLLVKTKSDLLKLMRFYKKFEARGD